MDSFTQSLVYELVFYVCLICHYQNFVGNHLSAKCYFLCLKPEILPPIRSDDYN